MNDGPCYPADSAEKQPWDNQQYGEQEHLTQPAAPFDGLQSGGIVPDGEKAQCADGAHSCGQRRRRGTGEGAC